VTSPVTPLVRVATHDADTVAAIHAALDARRPIALLHAKLPVDEQARQRAVVEAATFTDDDAVILFTSGSTGTARGVMLSRAAIDAAAEASWAHLGVHANDRWLCTLPMAHAGGLSIVVRCRTRGVTCVLSVDDHASAARARTRTRTRETCTCTCSCSIPDEAAGLSAALHTAAENDDRHHGDGTGDRARARARDTCTCTCTCTTPVDAARADGNDTADGARDTGAIPDDITLASLVPAQLADLLADPDWRPSPALRAVLLGGAAAPRSLVDAAIARGVPVLPTYGLTETFGQIATARVPGGPLHLLPGVAVDGGTRAEPARLTIRGPMLASRYLDGTPIAPALVTSDLGFVEDGILHVIGRADDVIITGGENVHPTQVEAVLASTPGVRAAIAFGVADARWGQLVAAAVAVDPTFDRDAALARWHASLPPFARPRRLAVVSELPRLPSGKLDRRQVVTLATAPIEYP
jgi:acyl-CoA synthetase (AMP-forming)/AMP-acid ligase II